MSEQHGPNKRPSTCRIMAMTIPEIRQLYYVQALVKRGDKAAQQAAVMLYGFSEEQGTSLRQFGYFMQELEKYRREDIIFAKKGFEDVLTGVRNLVIKNPGDESGVKSCDLVPTTKCNECHE